MQSLLLMPELDDGSGSLETCDSEVGEKMDDENDSQGDAGFESVETAVEAFEDVDCEEEEFRNTADGPCGRVRGNAD